jgi:hypothetical protein
MRCDQVQERLSEYLEDLLDAESRTSVHDHLSSCPHCQAEAQALSQMRQAVADLPVIEPPSGFSQRVMSRIREEAEGPSLWRRLFVPFRIKIPIHAMAILLVGGLAVYLYQVNKPVRTEVALMKPSEPPPSSDIQTYSQPPSSPVPPPFERKTEEMDETAPKTPGRMEGLRRENKPAEQGTAGVLQAEKKAKLEAAGKNTAKEMPAMKAAAAPYFVRELTLTPNEPIEGMKVLAPKLKAIVQKVGGEYPASAESDDALKQDLLLKPQTIWLTIPGDRFGQFKTGLAALGRVQDSFVGQETPPASMAAPGSSVEVAPSLRIKLTLQPPEKQK